MSGLLRRLSRRRPATADETGSPVPASSEPAGAPAETPAEPGGGQPVPDEQATRVLPATAAQPAAAEPPATAQPEAAPEPPPPVRDLPAGIDPSELAAAPAASASRGKLRRRLRYLREVRQLLLRDLGGFMYEIHRSAGGTPQEPQRKLAESKARRIESLDAEVRGLEAHLAEPHAGAVLREPGIGGLCAECGELHASDAQYCSRCGAPLNAKARAKRDAAAAQPATGAQPAIEPAPASVLWAGGPKPRAHAATEPEKENTEPSIVTNEWLALPKKPDDAPAATRPAPKPAEPAEAREAAARDESPAADQPASSGDATTADEPAASGDATARLDAVSDDAPAETPQANEPAGDFEPNGKRAEDVPEPEPLADPLSSRREQGS
jgi:hypothetical protein